MCSKMQATVLLAGWLLAATVPQPTLAISNQHCGNANPVVVEVFPAPSNCGSIPGAVCKRFSVSVNSLQVDPITVQIRIHEPTVMPAHGTILLGTGENGLAWFEDQVGSDPFIQDLQHGGYRVVQRAWDTDWRNNPTADAGLLATSCRYLGLSKYIRDNIAVVNQPFCVAGNSGGAAEIGYALAAHDASTFIDAAFLNSGPPMGVFELCDDYPLMEDDYQDQGVSPLDSQWPTTCMGFLEDLTDLVAPEVIEDKFTCDEEELDDGTKFTLGRPRCAYLNPQKDGLDRNWGTIEDGFGGINLANVCAAYTLTTEATLSAAHFENLDLDLWDTGDNPYVSFMFGGRDCTEAVSSGMFVYSQWESANATQVDLEFIEDSGHNIHGSSDGRMALSTKLLTHCN